MIIDQIDKLRKHGVVEIDAAGHELLRVAIQKKQKFTGNTMAVRKTELQCWIKEISHAVRQNNGRLIAGSESVTGQFVEALLPLEILEADTLQSEISGIGIELVIPRQVLQQD